MAVQIYAGNLSYRMTEEGLKSIFGEFGEVTSVKIVMDRETGRSKGFAFVEMTEQNAADKAIAQLDGKDIEGRNIKVNIARPKK